MPTSLLRNFIIAMVCETSATSKGQHFLLLYSGSKNDFEIPRGIQKGTQIWLYIYMKKLFVGYIFGNSCLKLIFIRL